MPADQRGRLDNDQGLPPVEASGKPGQGETGGRGDAPGLDVAFLIQRQLFAQKEIFRGKGSEEAQTHPEATPAIAEEHEHRRDARSEVTNQAHETYHRQGFPLRVR